MAALWLTEIRSFAGPNIATSTRHSRQRPDMSVSGGVVLVYCAEWAFALPVDDMQSFDMVRVDTLALSA